MKVTKTKLILGGATAVLFALTLWGSYTNIEPDAVLPVSATNERIDGEGKPPVGATYTSTILEIGEKLLTKNGGYLSNDILVKVGLYDNMPNWELGVVYMLRDAAESLRNDFSRSQSQSLENPDLKMSVPMLSFEHNSWIIPSTEGRYGEAFAGIDAYLVDMINPNKQDTQFYARADNLVIYLKKVSKRMGGLSQNLVASVGQERANTNLSGERGAEETTSSAQSSREKTPWLDIDDKFWEARGSMYALTAMFKAIRIDFEGVLKDKNALASLDQIIIEMEETQTVLWSPMVLNGGGFGVMANHSLAMASFVSRANAAIIDLQNLLEKG
jgi:hypothetical protein